MTTTDNSPESFELHSLAKARRLRGEKPRAIYAPAASTDLWRERIRERWHDAGMGPTLVVDGIVPEPPKPEPPKPKRRRRAKRKKPPKLSTIPGRLLMADMQRRYRVGSQTILKRIRQRKLPPPIGGRGATAWWQLGAILSWEAEAGERAERTVRRRKYQGEQIRARNMVDREAEIISFAATVAARAATVAARAATSDAEK